MIHAAGTASVSTSLASPLDDLKASALTWANVLESVRRSGTSAVIFFPSSAAVYGNPPALPVREVNVGSGREINVVDLAKRVRNLVAPEKEIQCRGYKPRQSSSMARGH